MSVTYDANMVKQNVDDQTIYFTLTDSILTDYEWVCDAPKGINIQNYLDSKEDDFLLQIRRREYPGGVMGRDYEYDPETQTELEAVEAWIAAGAPIKDDEGTTIGNVNLVPWAYAFSDLSSPVDRKDITQEQLNKAGQGLLQTRIENLEEIIFGYLLP